MSDLEILERIEQRIGRKLKRMTREERAAHDGYPDAAFVLDGQERAVGLWIGNAPGLPLDDVCDLSALADLVLRNCGIDSVAPLSRLTNLGLVDLAGNAIYDLAPVRALRRLRLLYLDRNRIADIEPVSGLRELLGFAIGSNQVHDLGPLAGLAALWELDVESNPVSDLAPLAGLRSLGFLGLAYCQVMDLAPLAGLRSLEWVALGGNRISDLGPLAGLTNLVFLHADHNQIKDLRPLAGLEKLEALTIDGNPIESPPPDVVAQGPAAIRSYFKLRQRQASERLFEAKVLFVGEPGAGKTSLMHKLLDPGYKVPQPEQASTLGIEINLDWQFPWHKDPGRNLRAHLWDFGGQNIQYYLHQFFLTQHSLYVLVLDDRKDCENVDYWFDIIQVLGDGCPVLVVQNEKLLHGASGFSLDQAVYAKRYGERLKLQFFRVDLSKDDGRLAKIREAAKEAISGLGHIGESLPAGWIKVRERLKELAAARPHIPWREYQKVCTEEDIPDEPDQLVLSRRLHDLGIVLHYQEDPSLSDTVFLSPQWVTRAMYVVLADQRLIEQEAVFSRDWVFKAWGKDYGQGDKALLLRLMQKSDFDLCYELAAQHAARSSGGSDRYLVPQLLRNAAPELATRWPHAESLRFQYRYAFMPEGIVTRLSVRLADKIHRPKARDLIWRNGVILGLEEALALVQRERDSEGRQIIDVSVQGPRLAAQQLLGVIRGEISRLHGTAFRRLPVEQWIPCSCANCQRATMPTLFALERIKLHLDQRRDKITCERAEGFSEIPILRLLEGVLPPEARRVAMCEHDIEADRGGSKDEIAALLRQTVGGPSIVIAPHFEVSQTAQAAPVRAPEPERKKGLFERIKDRITIVHMLIAIAAALLAFFGISYRNSCTPTMSPASGSPTPQQPASAVVDMAQPNPPQ